MPSFTLDRMHAYASILAQRRRRRTGCREGRGWPESVHGADRRRHVHYTLVLSVRVLSPRHGCAALPARRHAVAGGACSLRVVLRRGPSNRVARRMEARLRGFCVPLQAPRRLNANVGHAPGSKSALAAVHAPRARRKRLSKTIATTAACYAAGRRVAVAAHRYRCGCVVPPRRSCRLRPRDEPHRERAGLAGDERLEARPVALRLGAAVRVGDGQRAARGRLDRRQLLPAHTAARTPMRTRILSLRPCDVSETWCARTTTCSTLAACPSAGAQRRRRTRAGPRAW